MLYADNVTDAALIRAAQRAGVTIHRLERRNARKRAARLDVTLSGSSSRNTRNEPVHGATWDEWGIFLGVLFRYDDTLTVPGVYEDAEHFHWSTGGRFGRLTRLPMDSSWLMRKARTRRSGPSCASAP